MCEKLNYIFFWVASPLCGSHQVYCGRSENLQFPALYFRVSRAESGMTGFFNLTAALKR
jgi:hypothetical protein